MRELLFKYARYTTDFFNGEIVFVPLKKAALPKRREKYFDYSVYLPLLSFIPKPVRPDRCSIHLYPNGLYHRVPNPGFCNAFYLKERIMLRPFQS